MLDMFRYGSVTRISPEAPVPVMHVSSEHAMLGGAGNVLANLAALECFCGLIAVVGDDKSGLQCQRMLSSIGVDPTLLIVAPSRVTTLKTRLVSGSQQLLRCDEEDASPLGTEIETQIIARFDAAIAKYNAVAISDYAKGMLSDRVLRHVIEHCRRLDIPVVVDPKRRDLTAYAGATAIKPNRSELAAFIGTPCSNLSISRVAAEHAMATTGSSILLTLSEDGMALFRPGMEMQHFHATATEVYDVSGAGDTALAIFSAGIAARLAMDEAAMLANAGAGAVVRKLGTATLSRAELSRAVAAVDEPRIGAVCGIDDAARLVAHWKDEGLRVGFTNGCFDIVHAGHIEILRQARARCDHLVVGLNSDKSVARLKGPNRPIQPETSRAQVLAAIDAVDLVVIFDDDTPLELIKALMPTELIKGADYTEDAVVGAREVKADGGRVHLIELVPGLSTTRAVERIQQGLEIAR
ncbi:D-glycero-beta-D-manno-heptose 1-phosphate adenylyltransferase [Sphingomonas sp. So64.6b]|nr:D-glycero-beta-D-manno-heptose 1-phosphate adenylyltransferase [Sphingomonas sp. So64.6b]